MWIAIHDSMHVSWVLLLFFSSLLHVILIGLFFMYFVFNIVTL